MVDLQVTTPTPTVTDPTNQTAEAGATASFTAPGSSTAGTVTYQWQVSTDNGSTWVDVSTGTGGTTSSYTTAALTGTDNAAKYRVIVTNTVTGLSDPQAVESGSATLTVTTSTPSITTQPTDATKLAGQTAEFSVTADSAYGALSYQWQVSADAGATWTDVTSGTGGMTAKYTTAALSGPDNGARYQVVVTNTVTGLADTKSVTSDEAALTVTTPVPTIVKSPAGLSKYAGETATFTVVATTTAGVLTYQWQSDTGPGGTWEDIAGQTSATYTTGGLATGDSGRRFRVVVTNTVTGLGDVQVVDSDAATLSVSERPADPLPEPAPTATSTPSTAPIPTVDNLDPIGQVQNPNIPAGGLKAGGSVFLLNGQPQPLTLKPNAKSDPSGLVVSGDGWTMRLQGRGGANDPLGLTSQQALVLESEPVQRARSVVAAKAKVQPSALSSGTGFKANSVVKFYILPNIYMGSLPTDASGNYEGRVPVPAGVPAGVHTMQVNGYAPDDAVRSLSLGVLVKPAEGTKVRTAQAGATVLFAANSPVLTAQGKAALRALVKKTGRDAVKVASVGFVQKAGSSSNNQSLSTARAKAVGAYLRGLGVKGAYTVRGDGVGGPGAKDRKVVVTVTYRR